MAGDGTESLTASMRMPSKGLSPLTRQHSKQAVSFISKSHNFIAVSIFVALCARFAWLAQAKHRAVQKLLADFDRDSSDRLSPGELQRLLLDNGIGFNVTQVSTLFGKVDEEHDGFDNSELSSILSFVSDLPSASPKLQALRDIRSWVWDIVLLVLTGLGLTYVLYQSQRSQSRWAANLLRAAVHAKKATSDIAKFKSEAERLQREHLDLEKKLREKEAEGDEKETRRLQSRLDEVSKEEARVVQKLREEVDGYKSQARKSVEDAEKALKKVQRITSCISSIDSFRGAGHNMMGDEGAQQGFESVEVGFAMDTITFGTMEDGRLLMYETSDAWKLGEGRDCAYLAAEIESGSKFALKKYRIKNPDQRKSAMRDLLALRTAVGDHPNIMKYERVIESAETVYALMEYITGKDLFDVVVATPGGIAEAEATALFRDLTSAVRHLHEREVIHCDIKPENAMVEGGTASGRLKLIDFGCSCFLRHQPPEELLLPTDAYTPPEHGPFGKRPRPNGASDVWRLGCTLFIMLVRSPPFANDGFTRAGYDNRMSDAFYKQFPQYAALSSDAKDLISHLIVGDSTKRLLVDDVLAHPWLHPVNRAG